MRFDGAVEISWAGDADALPYDDAIDAQGVAAMQRAGQGTALHVVLANAEGGGGTVHYAMHGWSPLRLVSRRSRLQPVS